MNNVLANIKKILTGTLATEGYVDEQIAKLKSDIIEYLNETGIRADINDLTELAKRHEITLQELYNIIKPEEENLKKLRTNMATIQAISDAIYKAHTSSGKSKPNKPQYPIIDEEFEEDIRGTEQRYNKLKSLKIFQSESQMEYLFTIEMSLKDIPMFNGKTLDDISKYITTYQKDFTEWKKRNKISYVIIPFKNNMNNNISYKQGVCYNYGK